MMLNLAKLVLAPSTVFGAAILRICTHLAKARSLPLRSLSTFSWVAASWYAMGALASVTELAARMAASALDVEGFITLASFTFVTVWLGVAFWMVALRLDARARN